MTEKQNIFYSKEFPSLSETNVQSNFQANVDTVSYSSKLKMFSSERVEERNSSLLEINNGLSTLTSINKASSSSCINTIEKQKPHLKSNQNKSALSEDLHFKAIKTNKIFKNSTQACASAVKLKNDSSIQREEESGWMVVCKKSASHQNIVDSNAKQKIQCKSKTKKLSEAPSFSNTSHHSVLSAKSNRPAVNKNNENELSVLRRSAGTRKRESEISNFISNCDSLTEKSYCDKSSRSSCHYEFNANLIEKNFSSDITNITAKKQKSSTFRVSNSDSHKIRTLQNYETSKTTVSSAKHILSSSFKSSKKENSSSVVNTSSGYSSGLPVENGCLTHKKEACIKASHDIANSKISNTAKSNKRKRKSKMKRQAAFQSGKIQIISSEVHHRILNQKKKEIAEPNRNIVLNINDAEEYPELNKAVSSRISDKNEFSLKNFQKIAGNQELSEEEIVLSSFEITPDVAETKHKENVPESSECEKVPVHHGESITVSLWDMLLAKKVGQKDAKKNGKFHEEKYFSKTKEKKIIRQIVNPLDSSKPAVKRGKEREKPKLKKPSLLKKIILQDREKRKTRQFHRRNRTAVIQEETENIDASDAKFDESQCAETLKVSLDPLHSDNNSDEIYLPDVRWLFGFQGKCFHRISRFKCIICDENDMGEDSVLLCLRFVFDTEEQNLTKKKQAKTLDSTLGDIRHLFKNQTKSKLHTSGNIRDSIIDDMHYLFTEMYSTEYSPSSGFLEQPFDSNSQSRENSVSIIDNTLSNNEDQSNFYCDNRKLDNFNENLSNEIVSDISSNLEVTSSFNDKLKVLSSHLQCTNEKFSAISNMLHSKKFRMYCDHFLNETLEKTVFALVDDLARFQDRMHLKDPVKARMKKRLLYGLREIKRHMKLRKLKSVIIASDIENSESEGGLNDNVNELKSLAKENQIPCVFALQRRKLGRLCRKPTPVSAIGILNYEGSEENFKKMLTVQSECRADYAKVVKSLPCHLTDAHVAQICKAREEDPSLLRPLTTSILMEVYPKPVDGIPPSSDAHQCTNGWNTPFHNMDGGNETFLSNKTTEDGRNEKIEVYNVLKKYKIINY